MIDRHFRRAPIRRVGETFLSLRVELILRSSHSRAETFPVIVSGFGRGSVTGRHYVSVTLQSAIIIALIMLKGVY